MICPNDLLPTLCRTESLRFDFLRNRAASSATSCPDALTSACKEELLTCKNSNDLINTSEFIIRFIIHLICFENLNNYFYKVHAKSI